jgi:CRP-like cAMP-binding protein
MSASIKLARLLLNLGARGQKTELRVRIHRPVTQEEIGQYIAACRATVTLPLPTSRVSDS